MLDAHATHYSEGFHTTLQIPDPAHRAQVNEAVDALLRPWWSRYVAGYDALFSGFVCKGPGAGALSWHQDIRVTPWEAPPALSLWLPLQATGTQNGGLAVAPGSHKLDGRRAVGDAPPASWAAEFPPLQLELARGEAVLFHPALVHGSAENATGRIRAAATVLLIPKDVPLTLFTPEPTPLPRSFFLSGDLFSVGRRS